MARSFTQAEWELLDLPRRIAYEEKWFTHPRMEREARANHASLLARKEELELRIRRAQVLDRWYMRKYRYQRPVGAVSKPGPLTDMGMDEVIEGGKIVDKG